LLDVAKVQLADGLAIVETIIRLTSTGFECVNIINQKKKCFFNFQFSISCRDEADVAHVRVGFIIKHPK
jgi:Zn-dependent M16 (insulinase) family peptidase